MWLAATILDSVDDTILKPRREVEPSPLYKEGNRGLHKTQLVSHRGKIRTQAWLPHCAPHPGLLSTLEKTNGNRTCVGDKAAQLIKTSRLLLLA